jgi:chloramphenicol-sensitive protein RarD
MNRPAITSASQRDERSALIAGFAAFATWGLIPVYWKLLKTVPADEIIAHRCVWTTLFLIGLLTWQRRWPELREAACSRRTLL